MPLPVARALLDIHLDPHHWLRALLDEARRSLATAPRELSPTWFYDERGCELFEAITELPEYYPTRAERAILRARALDIAAATDADLLVELGAGSATKTRILLDAMTEFGRLATYVPFDVAESAVVATADALVDDYPGLTVHGVVGDFRHHLGRLPNGGRRVIAFLGGTVGNLRPHERAAMLRTLAASMRPGDSLLLGTDLVKEPDRLVAAYDDHAGITAAFNRNALAALNRATGADFVPSRFAHEARWNRGQQWIEMHLRSIGRQRVSLPALDLTIELADGETIRTEISAKFREAGVRDELRRAGLELRHWWTDPAGDFALSLATP